MKVGDLVALVDDDTYKGKMGIVTHVLDYHWDCDLPGYVKGGETFRVHWPHRGDGAHYSLEELKLVNDSEDLEETTPN